LWVSICLDTPGCDIASATQALREIDPGNGLGDWPALRTAVVRDDPSAIDDALQRLSEARTFNLYFNPTVVTVAEALAHTGLPSQPRGRRTRDPAQWATTAAGFGARITPPLKSISDACRGDTLLATHRSRCLKIAATLMTADTSILQSFGASLTQRLAAPHSAEHASTLAWRHGLEWRQLQSREALKPFRQRRWTAEFMRAMRTHPREEDAARAVLVAMGLPPDPPRGWKPPER
jgi:hypothetical protein